MEEEVFASYMQWVYTGHVVLKMDGNERTKQDKKFDWTPLAELYVAADALGDLRLQNAVIDRILALRRETDTLPKSSAVCTAYTGTPEGSLLRHLFIDWYVSECAADAVQKHGHEFPSG